MANVASIQTRSAASEYVNQEEINEEFASLMAGEVRRQTPDVIFDDNTFARIERIASVMAAGVSTIPKHLQGNKADCFAVAMQASKWNMDPFIVAQKTHLVSSTLGYESQLINAVIIGSKLTVGRPEFTIGGDWKAAKSSASADAWVEVSATIKGEANPRILRLNWSDVQTKNSPLWKSKPEQQACYLALKYWSRLHTPDVIMGVYSPDELGDHLAQTPIRPINLDTPNDILETTIQAINDSKTLEELSTHRATALTFKGAGRRRAAEAVAAKRAELESIKDGHGQITETDSVSQEMVNQETGEITEPKHADWISGLEACDTKSDLAALLKDMPSDVKSELMESHIRPRQDVINGNAR
jgi:hypothetical protein